DIAVGCSSASLPEIDLGIGVDGEVEQRRHTARHRSRLHHHRTNSSSVGHFHGNVSVYDVTSTIVRIDERSSERNDRSERLLDLIRSDQSQRIAERNRLSAFLLLESAINGTVLRRAIDA